MKKFLYLVWITIISSSCDTPVRGGDGVRVESSDTVVILFRLSNGQGMRFDDSFQPSGNLPLRLVSGRGDVIHGLERELRGHGVGDTISSFILPEEGYGKHGVYYRDHDKDTMYVIAPDDTIRFEAVILDIKR